MIDPPGFALESFNPIGGWRDRFRSLGVGDRVDIRDLLVKNEDLLAKTLVTKLLTFATGREMGFSDRQMISRLVAKSKANGHGVRDLIELVVTSDAFRRK
jgi:hypothetical protein